MGEIYHSLEYSTVFYYTWRNNMGVRGPLTSMWNAAYIYIFDKEK